MNIFLVGPMGAGKSTIGRILSRELNLEFVDSDKEIEERAGADIPWIFDMEGEQGFRDREAAVIADLSQQSNIVLATGGGAILREENRQNLESRGTLIYLYASIQQQLNRTAKDKNRPLIQTENPKAVLTQLMETRDPLYRNSCDFMVETDNRRPRVVAREIIRWLEENS